MVIFCRIKYYRGDNLGEYLRVQTCLQIVSDFLGQRFLLIIMIEDYRLVLVRIRYSRGAMTVPEYIQKVMIRYHRRVVFDFNRFTVITETVIRGIFFVTARIADARADDTLETPEPGVGTPESAQCKCSRLRG